MLSRLFDGESFKIDEFVCLKGLKSILFLKFVDWFHMLLEEELEILSV